MLCKTHSSSAARSGQSYKFYSPPDNTITKSRVNHLFIILFPIGDQEKKNVCSPMCTRLDWLAMVRSSLHSVYTTHRARNNGCAYLLVFNNLLSMFCLFVRKSTLITIIFSPLCSIYPDQSAVINTLGSSNPLDSIAGNITFVILLS